MPGGGPRVYRSFLAIVAGVLGLWLCSAVQAQPPYVVPLPASPGAYVRVPHGRTYVYVPIDAGSVGVPAGDAPAPPPPAAEPPPRFWYSTAPAPRTPPTMPGSPGASTIGYLQAEIDSAGAEVWIDGRRAGVADVLGAARTLFALAPGTRRIEIRLTGFRPLRTEIRVVPGAVFSVRARLDPA